MAALVVVQAYRQHRHARHERPCTEAQDAAPVAARSLRRQEQHREPPVLGPAHALTLEAIDKQVYRTLLTGHPKDDVNI